MTAICTFSEDDFVVGDTLYVIFQLWGLTPELKQSGSLNYDIVRENGDKVKSFSRKLSAYQTPGVFMKKFLWKTGHRPTICSP